MKHADPSPVWIYSLVKNDVTLYVGQTADPMHRECNHRLENKLLRGALFRKLRKCSAFDGSRIERQIISSYWKRKQCPLNLQLPSGKPRTKDRRTPWAKEIIYNDTTYPSLESLARAIGVSSATIRKVLRSGETVESYVEESQNISEEFP